MCEAEGLCKQLVKIIKNKVPKATDSDFHSCGILHQAAAFFLFWFFFLSLVLFESSTSVPFSRYCANK